jgi:capsid protein
MGILNAWNELWKPNPRAIQKTKRRNFAGATVDRLTAGWITSTNSADSDIKGSIAKLRNRARQLNNDVDYVKGALRSITDNTVGTGVRVQAQVRKMRGGKLDPKINDQIERAWSKWGKADSCDVAGKLCFDDLCRGSLDKNDKRYDFW